MASLAPYADADVTLRALAGKAEGFGRFAVGGLHGPVYHVTTLSGTHLFPCTKKILFSSGKFYRMMNFTEDGVGSLREACGVVDPRWIVFDVSGTIELTSPLRVSSYKSIDGRGQRIKIIGNGLHLRKCEHVILCNLEFQGGRGHDVDAIKIKDGSKNIWIDRCSLREYDDGLIDITRGSTDITVSR